MIGLQVNGRRVELAEPTPLLAYLETLGVSPRAVAVEHNGVIIERSAYADAKLDDGDVVEIVRMVGGGASAAPDHPHDLDHVAIVELCVCVCRPLDDHPVVLDGYGSGAHAESLEICEQRSGLRKLDAPAVDLQPDHLRGVSAKSKSSWGGWNKLIAA